MNLTEKVAMELNWTTELRIVWIVILSLFIVTGIPGNFLVCFLVYQKPRLRTVTNIIISNLALADLAVCLFNIPIALATVIKARKLHGALCQFAGFTNSLFFFEVLLSLPLVSVSRYYCIVRPAQFTTLFSKRQTFKMIAATWCVSFVCAIPPFFGWSEFTFQEGKGTCALALRRDASTLTYTILILVITGFSLPFMFIIVPYFKIFRFIRTHSRRMSVTSSTSFGGHRRVSFFQDFKVTKLLLVVVCVFVACWTPNIIFSFLKTFEAVNLETQNKLDTTSILLVFLSSTCNPFIYGLMNTQFRKGFRDILCTLCRRCLPHRRGAWRKGSAEASGSCYRRQGTRDVVRDQSMADALQYESCV